MLTVINNPPRWLARALQIVEGVAAPAITTEIHQVVDAMQNGHGAAVHSLGVLAGSLAGGVNVIIGDATREDFAYLVRFSMNNPGTTTINVGADLAIQGQGNVRLTLRSVIAGSTQDWASFTSGQQYWYVPPKSTLTLSLAQFTTTAGNLVYEVVRVPAGTRPW